MITDFCFIVPYRNRVAHLREFVPHIKRRFKKVPIYIIEQADTKPFNRGKLLNVGFKYFGINHAYAAYHDIDMLPTKADYSFPADGPTHLATKVQQFNYMLPYENYFGGVVLFSSNDFITCGGYSNHFWGWGGEDDELYNRLTDLCMPIHRRTCYYQSLYHPRAYAGAYDPEKMKQSKLPRSANDGLEHTVYSINGMYANGYGFTKLSVTI